MAGLGWYIHATWAGYRKEGITKDGQWMPPKFEALRNGLKGRARSLGTISQEQKNQLKELIDSYLKPDAHLKRYLSEEQRKIIEEKLRKILIEEVDFENLSIKARQDGISKNKVKKMSSLTPQDALRILQEVDNVAKARFNDYQASQEILQQYNEAYKKIYKLIVNDLNQNGQGELKKAFSHKESIGIRNQILSLIDNYAKIPAVNLASGELYELALEQILNAAEDMGITEVKKIGDTLERVTIDADSFDKRFTSFTEFQNGVLSSSMSQGKGDISFKWDEQNYRASVKHYNLNNHWISLVSDTSLLFLLQDQSINEVNHILNLQASHSDGVGNLKALRNESIQTLKLLLFYKGLTGHSKGRKAANLFIIRDKNSGETYIYTMEEILNKVMDNSSWISVKVGLKTLHNDMTLSLKNKRVDSTPAEVRILKLLEDAKSRNVVVKMSTSVIK